MKILSGPGKKHGAASGGSGMRAALYGPQGLFYKGRGQNENFVLSPFLTHTLHEESGIKRFPTF